MHGLALWFLRKLEKHVFERNLPQIMLTWLHLLPPFWRLSPNDLDLPPIFPFYPNLRGLGSDKHSTTKNIAFERRIVETSAQFRKQHRCAHFCCKSTSITFSVVCKSWVQRVKHSWKLFCVTVGFQILFLYSTNVWFCFVLFDGGQM